MSYQHYGVDSKNFGRLKSYRVVDIQQSTRSFTWYLMCSEMSTSQSPVLNMSARVSKHTVGLVEIKITMFSKRKNSREK